MLETFATSEGMQAQISVTQQAFAIMAAMDVCPLVSARNPARQRFQATLSYKGACEGFLVLECSETLAFAFAGQLMMIATPTSFDDDVKDAIGELVNTIGGNLKGLLPANTQISMPLVCESSLQRGEGKAELCVSFITMACEHGHLNLSLYGKSATV